LRIRLSSSLFCAVLLAVSVDHSSPSSAATTSPPRPPDGTYSYTLSVGGVTYGTFTDVIDGASAGTIAVRENASMPAAQLVGTSTTRYTASTLQELGYTSDFTAANTKQHTDVTVMARGAHGVATPGGSVDIPLAAATAFIITTDNLAGWNLMVPSILHATMAKTFTLGVLQGGVALAVKVSSDAPPTRPAAALAGDASVTLTYPGFLETLWYDPATYVVHDIVVPAQSFEIQLTKMTPATAVLAAPALAVALPTPAPHFSSRDVHFTSADGTVLAGTLTVPDDAKRPCAAIVFIHGSGPQDRNETIGPNPIFLQLSNALSNDGYVVLRYDKRGIGESGGAQTGGTREQLLADIEAAFAFVSTQPEVDAKRVYLLGHSEGGELAPTVAARQPTVAGIILMAPPALPLSQVLMQQTLAMVPAAQSKDAEAQELADLQKLRTSNALRDAWLRSSLDVDPTVDIARVHVPILILQGGSDVQVRPTDLPRLAAAARATNRDVTIDTFDGLNHLFEPVPAGAAQTPEEAVAQYLSVPARVDDRVLAALAAWLQKHAG